MGRGGLPQECPTLGSLGASPAWHRSLLCRARKPQVCRILARTERAKRQAWFPFGPHISENNAQKAHLGCFGLQHGHLPCSASKRRETAGEQNSPKHQKAPQQPPNNSPPHSYRRRHAPSPGRREGLGFVTESPGLLETVPTHARKCRPAVQRGCSCPSKEDHCDRIPETFSDSLACCRPWLNSKALFSGKLTAGFKRLVTQNSRDL